MELLKKFTTWKAMVTLGVIMVLAFLAGCGSPGSTRGLTLYRGANLPPEQRENPDVLQVQYLRAGGFLLKRGSDEILTAPFYSNPGFLRVGLREISPNHERIDRHLPPVGEAQAILVGHAHYDHAMDLPYIVLNHATNAVVYGNQTLSNILSAELPSVRVVGLDDRAGHFRRDGKPGEWVTLPGGKIRFMALESEHAPHFGGITLYSGEVTEKLERLPRTAWGWKSGKTLVYLIDFLNEKGEADFRVLYQDTAVNSPPYGALPEWGIPDRKGIDVQILCMASFQEVKNYPGGTIADPKPGSVIVGHWEDFFRPPDAKLKVVRLTNGRKFMKNLAEVFPPKNTFLPVPGAWMVFEKRADSHPKD